MPEPVRHICGISGGKDSSALAVHMRERIPDMEYFFCDTGAELPETYEYLTRLEVILGKPPPPSHSAKADRPLCRPLCAAPCPRAGSDIDRHQEHEISRSRMDRR